MFIEHDHKYAIFALSRSDYLTRSQFSQVYQQVTGNKPVPMIGCYKGVTEHSYIGLAADLELVRGRCPEMFDTLVGTQESVLLVSECNKMYASLLYLGDGSLEYLGSMHEVSEVDALASDAWTYRPDMGVYWVAKKGNPDRTPEAEAQHKARHFVQACLAAENYFRRHNKSAAADAQHLIANFLKEQHGV